MFPGRSTMGHGTVAPMRARMTNDSRVYEVMRKSHRPMTVSEISRELPDIVEKTVRRAIESLRKNGFVVDAGRDNNSKLYMVAGMSGGNAGDKLVPFGNEVMTVEAFIKLIASPDSNPFGSRLKTEPLSEKLQQILRQRMLFAVMSAGEGGFNSQLETVQEALTKVVEEMERLTEMVRVFTNSPVWYDHYRDPIALEVRELQKKDPELWKLAWDFVKSGSANT